MLFSCFSSLLSVTSLRYTTVYRYHIYREAESSYPEILQYTTRKNHVPSIHNLHNQRRFPHTSIAKSPVPHLCYTKASSLRQHHNSCRHHCPIQDACRMIDQQNQYIDRSSGRLTSGGFPNGSQKKYRYTAAPSDSDRNYCHRNLRWHCQLHRVSAGQDL